MRKMAILLAGCIMGAAVFAADLGLTIRGGLNLGSKVKTEADVTVSGGGYSMNDSASADVDVKTGFNIGLEYEKSIMPSVFVGAGVEYISAPEDTENGDSLDISWMPIYALGKYSVPISEAFSGYGVIKLGYGIALFGSDHDEFDDKNGGLYYGIGGGVKYNNIVGELLFSQTSASEKIDETGSSYGTTVSIKGEATFTYPKLSLNFGYSF